MTIEQYVEAMPKVELNLRLEGAYNKETLRMIAEQNEIASEIKHFKKWVAYLDEPDLSQLAEIKKTFGQWLRFPEDITRLVYDAGVYLARQNVKYAEITVNPIPLMLHGMSFEDFMTALNDGRDRVERGWDVKIKWIFAVPRDEPRRADDIARWSVSVAGQKAGVVGFGLLGPEDSQPIGQFERAFNIVTKREIPLVAEVGTSMGVDGIAEVLGEVQVNRLIDGWGLSDSVEIIEQLAEENIAVTITPSKMTLYDYVAKPSDVPLRSLYDKNIKVVLSAEQPLFYEKSLNDEYLSAVQNAGLTIEDLNDIALNAIRYSFMPVDEKQALIASFEAEFQALAEQTEAPETP